MSTIRQSLSGSDLLTRLEHRSCTFCDEGSLVRGQYKGNDAVVCDQCRTPMMQIWDME
ncbi:HVO_A0556 family zinc finger protein [Haloterrigena salina]|uniref:HVO_A0556 family zinc finger protein n=1 Tax=Haloterrigena salina TaxID=504937 RepID=UPI00308439FE